MATPSIEEIHEEIEGRAGDTIKCPLCGQEAWTRLHDTVLTVLASSHEAFLRANGQDSTERTADDHWSVFAVDAFCSNCGYLRMHAVDPTKLLPAE